MFGVNLQERRGKARLRNLFCLSVGLVTVSVSGLQPKLSRRLLRGDVCAGDTSVCPAHLDNSILCFFFIYLFS